MLKTRPRSKDMDIGARRDFFFHRCYIGVFTQSAGQRVKGPHRGKEIGSKTDTHGVPFTGEPPSGRESRAGLSTETDMV